MKYFSIFLFVLLMSSSVCATNFWNDGPIQGVGGSVVCTGFRCQSNTYAPFPTSAKSIVVLNATGLPGYNHTSGFGSIYPISNYAEYKYKVSYATVGYNIYYAYKAINGTWYLVSHNVITNQKNYMSLRSTVGKISDVYQVFNYRSGVAILATTPTDAGGIPSGSTSRCVKNLTQVWFFDEDLSAAPTCLTCTAAGSYTTYASANKSCTTSGSCNGGCGTEYHYYMNGTCIKDGYGHCIVWQIKYCYVNKNYVYDWNNMSLDDTGTVVPGPFRSTVDCRNSAFNVTNYLYANTVVWNQKPTSVVVGPDDVLYLFSNVEYYTHFGAYFWSGVKVIAIKDNSIRGLSKNVVTPPYIPHMAMFYNGMLYTGKYRHNMFLPYMDPDQVKLLGNVYYSPPIGVFPGSNIWDVYSSINSQYLTDISNTYKGNETMEILGADIGFRFNKVSSPGMYKKIMVYDDVAAVLGKGNLTNSSGSRVWPNSYYGDGALTYAGGYDDFAFVSGTHIYGFRGVSGGDEVSSWDVNLAYPSTDLSITGDSTEGWSGVLLQNAGASLTMFTLISSNLPVCSYDDYACADGSLKGGKCNDFGSPLLSSSACLAKSDNGVSCSINANCKSGLCQGGICAATHYCDMDYGSATINTCLPVRVNGEACTRDAECSSGKCLNGTYLNYTGKLIGQRPNQYWGLALNLNSTGALQNESVIPANWVSPGVCVPISQQCSNFDGLTWQSKRFIGGVSQDTVSWLRLQSMGDVICPWDYSVVVNEGSSNFFNNINVSTKAFRTNMTYCDISTDTCKPYVAEFYADCSVGYRGNQTNTSYIRVLWPYSSNYISYGVYIGRTNLTMRYLTTVFSTSGCNSTMCFVDFNPTVTFVTRPNVIYVQVVGRVTAGGEFNHMAVYNGTKILGDKISQLTFMNTSNDNCVIPTTTTTTSTTTTSTTTSSTSTTLALPGKFTIHITDCDTSANLDGVVLTAKYFPSGTTTSTLSPVIKVCTSGLDGDCSINVQTCVGSWGLTGVKAGYTGIVTPADISVPTGGVSVPVCMKATTATDVGFTCVADATPIDAHYGTCTFNNIANLDNVDYDKILLSYLPSEERVYSGQLRLSPDTLAISVDGTFSSKSYNGLVTIDLYNRDLSLKCSRYDAACGILPGGHICTNGYTEIRPSVLSDDHWFIDPAHPHVLVGCLKSFNPSFPGLTTWVSYAKDDGSTSSRFGLGYFNILECYSDSDCVIPGVGNSKCVNNKCSGKPSFISGYPRSEIRGGAVGDNLQVVRLKWTSPNICKPNTGVGGLPCQVIPTTDLKFEIIRKSISGSLQTGPLSIGRVNGNIIEFVDGDITLDAIASGSTEEGLVDKVATYQVCAGLADGTRIFCSDDAAATLFGCEKSVDVDNKHRWCTGTNGCDADKVCVEMDNTKCAATTCVNDVDCIVSGCIFDLYSCQTGHCLPKVSACSIWASPGSPIACSDPTNTYCSQWDDTMVWVKDEGFTGYANYYTIKSNCYPKILSTSPNWELQKCYDDVQCGSGMSCTGNGGPLVMIDGSQLICSFHPTDRSANACYYGGNLVGYCYPDSKCRKSDGGRCSSATTTVCEPVFGNDDCPAGQYCDWDVKNCYEKKENGQSCPDSPSGGLYCKSGICVDGTCAGSPGTCDYTLCMDQYNKGANCGNLCPAGQLCVPVNWNDQNTWHTGQCVGALAVGANCGYPNSLGVPLSQLTSAIKAGWLCASSNCMGDYFPIDGKITGATCKPAGYHCDGNILVTNNALDPDHYCHCGPGSGGGSPCANIDGVTRAQALVEEVNNPKWCFMQSTSYPPAGQTVFNNNCFAKYADDASCDKDYQCASGVCDAGNHKCKTAQDKGHRNDPCKVMNVDSKTTTRWNSYDLNPESSSTTRYWDDNCGTDPIAGELYCEPCDYSDGKLYDNKNILCPFARVTSGTTGKCMPVQHQNDWCYSTSQCSSERISVSTGYQSLICTTDSTHPSACSKSQDPPNWYCYDNPINSASYNRFCLAKDASGCIHDSQQPWDQFTMYEDDTCYTMSQVGQSGTNMFCDDKQMCTYGTETKKCQDWPASTRAAVTYVTGNCVTNRCPVPADIKPYFSEQCWRDPGFPTWAVVNEPSHNVAPAAMNFVYCDTDGYCKWRKQAGATCGHDVECDMHLSCLTDHTCGIITGCTVDSDCRDPQKKCENGKCVFHGTEEFSVKAKNNLTKPSDSPFHTTYDYVVNCKDRDTVFIAEASRSMTVKYSVGGLAGGEKAFGDQNVMVSKVEDDLYDDLCDKELQANRKLSKTVSITFSQYAAGQKTGVESTKVIFVLARPLAVNMTRCSSTNNNQLCTTETKDAYILTSNNSVNGGLESRPMACDSAIQAGADYLQPIYPRTALDVFGNYFYAIIKDWKTQKYYKCVDQYGTVKVGSTLVNPAEYLFGLQFTTSQRVFILLVFLLGIPTLVLIGSRVVKRGG
jgi:hypothetical protein